MVQISNFSSLFEVSIALHLAYSFVKDLHSRPITRFQKASKDLNKLISDLKSESNCSADEIQSLESSLIYVQFGIMFMLQPFEKYINYFVKASIVFAIYSLSWIIFIGFCPEATFSIGQMIIMVTISLLPMPLFILITYIVMKRRVDSVQKDFIQTYDKYAELVKKLKKV